MRETKETFHGAGDALRFVCDASYALLPRDVAHQIGEMQKNLWGGVRWLAEKRIDWIEARVAGGDRLREEWQRRAGQGARPQTPAADAPGDGI